MSDLCRLIWCALIGLFRPRAALEAENLVLRHQLNVLRRKSPKRLTFGNVDRLVFTALYRVAPGVLDALKILKPQTVIHWHLAAGMLQDQKSIQQPKRDRRDYEQIHRRNAVGVVAQKDLPALRRWPPSPGHVFCYGGLPDIDAKLEQFAVDSRCSPKWVRDAHVANELANVRRCLWPATAPS